MAFKDFYVNEKYIKNKQKNNNTLFKAYYFVYDLKFKFL